jgi:hypothetical protein
MCSAILADEPVQACPPSAGYRLRKFVQRNRPQVIAAGLVLVALLAGIASTTWQAIQAERARIEAEHNEQKAVAAASAEVTAQQEANDKRIAAEKAAAAEAVARKKEAEERAFAQAIADFVKSDFLALTSVEGQRRFDGRQLTKDSTLKDLLDRAAKKLDERHDLDPRIEAELRWIIGVSYRGAGDPQRAVSFLERSVELRRNLLGPQDEATLNAQNSLAVAYDAAGRHDLAVPIHEEILRVEKAKVGDHHPSLLASMTNLATAYAAAQKPDLAVPLSQECLKRAKDALGAEHPETFRIMGMLGECYLMSGKVDLALPLLEKSFKGRRATQGADDLVTLLLMNNLAAAYQAAGKQDMALPIFEESLKLVRRKLGSDHPDTLVSMNSLASAYQATGQLARAMPLFEETLEKRKARLGPDHPATLTSMNNLAVAHWAAGKRELAVLHWEETLKLRKAKLGADDPDTIATMNNLAEAYWSAGKKDSAMSLLEEAAEGMEKRRFQHEFAATIVPRLIVSHEHLKHYDQAETWQRKWLAAVKERSGADSVPYARELEALGRILLVQRKWTEAEAVLRECLAVYDKKEPDAWMTYYTKYVLACSIMSQNKFAAAAPLLQVAFEGMKRREATIPPKDQSRLIHVLDVLVQVHEVLGEKEKAAIWRQKLQDQKNKK